MTKTVPELPQDLRQRAEEKCRLNEATTLQTPSPEETAQLLHDLWVHQIELEMQNEELQQSQLALEASKARYVDLYELAPVAYITVSEAGLILECNLTAGSILGVPRGGVMKKAISQWIAKEDQDAWYLLRNNVAATHEPINVEMRIVRGDGTQLWCMVGAASLRDALGAMVTRVTLTDITERHQFELARQESEMQLRLVIRGGDIGFWDWDLRGSGLNVNERWCDMLGLDSKALALDIEVWNSRVHPDDAPKLVRLFEQVIQNPDSQGGEVEVRARHQDGHYVWILDRFRVVSRAADGTPLRAVGTHLDITERKRAEAAMQEMNRHLIQSRQHLRNLVALNETKLEQEKRHIAREVHDELGQILTALRMDLSLAIIRHADHAPDLLEVLNGMKMQVDRAVQGVRNVASSLRPAVLDMGLVTALEWLCQEFSKNGDVKCVRHGFGKRIAIDDARAVVIFRIVQEALTNIRKYAQATQVDITLERREIELSVEVRDNGIGFDSVAVSQRGTLGLLGMRERVVALGGQIEVASTPGQGTVIGLVIPIEPQVAKAPV